MKVTLNSVAVKALEDQEKAIAILSMRFTQWEGTCLLAACQNAAEMSFENRGYYLELALHLIQRNCKLSEILRLDPVNDWHLLMMTCEKKTHGWEVEHEQS